MTYVLDQAHSKNSSEEDISTPLDAPPTFSEVITPPDEDEDYLDVMLQKMIDVLTLGVYKVRNKKQKLQKLLPGVIESLPYSNFLLFFSFFNFCGSNTTFCYCYVALTVSICFILH